MYTPAYPSLLYKVGYKGIYITRKCYPDDKFSRRQKALTHKLQEQHEHSKINRNMAIGS